jgi:hypothetical protein
MNCAYHAEAPNVAFCIRCGRALCSDCTRTVRGSVYCESCLGDLVEGKGASAAPPARETVAGANPGAAFALGLIPGVGAIYNGEFIKAAFHILIFGLLHAIHEAVGDSQIHLLFALLMLGFYIYMPFEAYYTAKKRKLKAEGIELETPMDRLHEQLGGFENKEMWGGAALVVIGCLFLLDNFGLFDLNWFGRFWPVLLIVAGIWLLKRYQERPV